MAAKHLQQMIGEIIHHCPLLHQESPGISINVSQRLMHHSFLGLPSSPSTLNVEYAGSVI